VLESEVKQLKDALFRYCWWMRGSISITEAFDLCSEDREMINEIIKENIETAKKSKQPFW
jgi:hypothetical protein|tara:strand:+ start:1181 stop:1360 length:180 start_codon:yes stop_codon:yes gene_type:complete